MALLCSCLCLSLHICTGPQHEASVLLCLMWKLVSIRRDLRELCLNWSRQEKETEPSLRYRPEVAPLTPLRVTESILSSDADAHHLVLDLNLARVWDMDCQSLTDRKEESGATFILLCLL